MEHSQVPTSRAWFVWSLAAGFFLAEYFARVAPSVMVPDLMRSFDVNALALGALSAYFYMAYVGMQIPVGTLVDRFGPHRLLTVMAAVCGASCLLFSKTHHLFAAELGRFLMGLSAAFAFVGALKLASVWFPHSRFGFFAGTTQALGMLGAAIGEGPVSVIVLHIGWRGTMLAIGLVLMALALLIALIVRDHPSRLQRLETPKFIEPAQSSLIRGIGCVLRNPQTWLNALFIGTLYAPTTAFAELWGASYLHRVYALKPEIAATAISMIFVGWALGSPLAGWCSDRIRQRKPILILSAVMSLVLITMVLYIPNLSVHAVFVLLFFYGVSNVGVATSYVVACEINPASVSATSMSVANMASVLIGALFQPMIGGLLDYRWNHRVVDGIPYYSADNFHIAMLSLPFCLIISIAAACLMKESYQSKNL